MVIERFQVSSLVDNLRASINQKKTLGQKAKCLVIRAI